MAIYYNIFELKAKSIQLERYKQEMEQIISQLDSEIEFLKTGWDGAAKEAFILKFNEFKSTSKQYSATIGKLSSQINTAATNIHNADSKMASQWR